MRSVLVRWPGGNNQTPTREPFGGVTGARPSCRLIAMALSSKPRFS